MSTINTLCNALKLKDISGKFNWVNDIIVPKDALVILHGNLEEPEYMDIAMKLLDFLGEAAKADHKVLISLQAPCALSNDGAHIVRHPNNLMDIAGTKAVFMYMNRPVRDTLDALSHFKPSTPVNIVGIHHTFEDMAENKFRKAIRTARGSLYQPVVLICIKSDHIEVSDPGTIDPPVCIQR